DPEAVAVRCKFRGSWRDAEGGVVEEADFAVRVTHAGTPASHSRGGFTPRPSVRANRVECARPGATHVDEVEHVLEGEGVVHRAALELAAVSEYLLGNLAVEDLQPSVQPS